MTAFGRMMIELTKKHVEEMFTISNGYEHDAQVDRSALFAWSRMIIMSLNYSFS